jgi:hypothetical protein
MSPYDVGMASPSSGDLFRKKVRETVEHIIQKAGLEGRFRVVMEYTSPHGSVIREQGRKVDVAVLLKRDEGPSPYLFAALLKRDEDLPYLFLECKWQSERGSAQDKLFRAAEEARRDRALGVHSAVVVGGPGFADNVRRWALTEGFIHEAFLEAWLREFFEIRTKRRRRRG